VKLTPGDAVRIGREVQGMTQADLAAASGIRAATIAAIEGGRVKLGADRAERLARALKVHPAVLVWPNWSADEDAASSGATAGEASAPHRKPLTTRK